MAMLRQQQQQTLATAMAMAAPTSLTQWNAVQQQSADQIDVAGLLERIRAELRAQGVMAWVRLGLSLEHFGGESSGVGKATLKRVLAESRLDISDVDARAVVKHLCGLDEGKAPVDDVKTLLCGPLTGARLDLVQSVFDALDKKRLGYVPLQDVLRAHDAAKHPGVMFGDKTPAQAQQEFRDSFQASICQTAAASGTVFVSLGQWMTYFQYMSGQIPNDEYFELLLKRVWRAAPRQSLDEVTTGRQISAPPMSLLEAIQDNRIPVSDSIRPVLSVSAPPPAPVVGRGQKGDIASRKTVTTTTEFLKSSQFAACLVDASLSPVTSPKAVATQHATAGLDAGAAAVLAKLRASLKARGIGALVALTRTLRLSDENGDGRLSLAEFKNAVKSEPTMQQLSDVDLRCLFKHLDRGNMGAVPLGDVLNLIREPMGVRRRQLVRLAFQFLDKPKLGLLDPLEVVQSYDASRHPDMIAQRKTEEQLFEEFVENFDVLEEGSASASANQGKVSPAQWEQYYHNVSFFVPDDDFFELMVRNTWQLPAGLMASIAPAPASAAPPMLSPSVICPLSAKASRGSGHSSHQALTILQPDLADQHHERAATGASFGLLSPTGQQLAASTPANMYSTSKQSKDLRRVIHQLRLALKELGAVGFISLQRQFRAMDSDGNGSISLHEFVHALRDSRVHLPPLDAKNLFYYFDANHDGSIDFDEFLSGIREPMNERRMLFVRMAFDLLDKDGNGVLEVSDIMDVYDARRHPEVMSGRKTEEDVFAEFLDTFDVSHQGDGKVGFDDWTRYYANISAAIDDDDYFELMMRNAWHISGGHGWSANSSNRRVLVTNADGSASVQEVPNDLGVKREDVPRLMAATAAAAGRSVTRTSFYDVLDHTTRPTIQEPTAQPPRRTNNNASNAIAACLGNERIAPVTAAAAVRPAPQQPVVPSTREPPAGVQAILAKVKVALKAQGAHGFCGLSRKFRLMDEDGNGALNLGEFRNAVAACNLAVPDADVRLLFQYFDSNRNGSIDLNEFVGGVRDPMNERRVGFVREAFRRMDKDGNGLLEPSDIVEGYDASQHPDVLSGRKTTEQVCREFLETFDVEGAHNGKVTWDQWRHYYHNISASIDDDDYFELMMRNAWHISGGVGWCANSTTRRVLVTLADGTDVVKEVKDDLGVKIQDVRARLQQQERQQERQQASSSNPIVHVAMTTTLDLTDKRSSASSRDATNGKRIMSLKDISNGAKMDMAPAPIASTSDCAGDAVLHVIRQCLCQKSVVEVAQLRKRLELSVEAKTATLAAPHCREAINAALGLTLTDAHCVSLFDYLRQCVDVEPSRTVQRVNSASSVQFNRISIRVLLDGLFGVLSPQCAAAVERLFSSLQAAGRGRVFPAALAKSFQASNHPSVKLGLCSATDVFQEFALALELPGSSDGAVAIEHLAAYCVALRATLRSDDHLILLLRDCFVA